MGKEHKQLKQHTETAQADSPFPADGHQSVLNKMNKHSDKQEADEQWHLE